MKNLIIVESPTKAKTINKFLGKDYTIKSSFGHIRDLPKSKMGIDIENRFTPKYVIPAKAKKNVTDLKKESQKADKVYLATDEDREGEAISWHLVKALDLPKGKYQRIAFHEITKPAVLNALKNPRNISENLVDAQQARRIIDRLVGYELSPFLWSKIRIGLSAGRVQSIALRLIAEREEEIKKFKPEEYWSVKALLSKDKKEFEAFLKKIDGKTLTKLQIKDKKESQKIKNDLEKSKFEVEKITKKETLRNPNPPFTTSSLQQEASRKLGFTSKKTMFLAQKLYENGLITYMRTDSVSISDEAIKQIRPFIKSKFGEKYLPQSPKTYKTKTRNAQEAHESIRPTTFSDSSEITSKLSDQELRLYKLIFNRAVSSQMQPARFDSLSIDIVAGKYLLRATGLILKFDGFLKMLNETSKDVILPNLKEKDNLNLEKIIPEQHFTQPPPRYTEASLVKALEEHGVGRPSTYAPTISLIQDRDYVEKDEQKRFAPTELGSLVNSILVEHFPQVVDIKFTASLEEDFDKISRGENKWIPTVESFYFPFHENLEKKDKEVKKEDIQKTDKICPLCKKPVLLKYGRFGKFYACSGYPDCKHTEKSEEDKKLEKEIKKEKCEKCGSDMTLKRGRFGPFLGCSAYPECKNIKPIEKSTNVKCPKCNKGELIEKRSKSKKLFYGCNQYPKCDFATWAKPIEKKCPECKFPLTIAGKKHKCSNKECSFTEIAA